MSSTDQTASEFFESLTGFDEIAIAKAFGRNVVTLSSEDQMGFARSLVFVAQRRGGMNDRDAYQAAMGMTLKEVNAYFAEEEDEAVPDDPSTESGKGERLPGTQPLSSRPSVS